MFPNGGDLLKAGFIKGIRDGNGATAFEAKAERKPAIDPRVGMLVDRAVRHQVNPKIFAPLIAGEINSNIDTLVTHQLPDLQAKFLASSGPNTFTVHGDDAPTFYLAKKGVGALSQTDADTRQFERTIAGKRVKVHKGKAVIDHLQTVPRRKVRALLGSAPT